LYDEIVVELVDNQLRQLIRLAKNQSTVFPVTKVMPIGPGGLDPAVKKFLVYLLIPLTGKDTHRDRRPGINVAAAEELPIVQVYIRDISTLELIIHQVYFIGKYPGMTVQQPVPDSFLKDHFMHGRKGNAWHSVPVYRFQHPCIQPIPEFTYF
jgi:hypothetical protein